MEVLIRVDAAPDVGLGHFMRCLSLVQAMRANIEGFLFEFSFLCCVLPVSLERLLKQEQITLVKLNFDQIEIGGQRDLEQTVEIAKKSRDALIVLDSYKLDYKFQKALFKENCRIFLFDDDCRHEEYYADLVLNQTFGASEQAYLAKRRNENSRFLIGPEFILLREEFRGFVGRRKKVEKEVRNVLMSVGGSDLALVLQKSYDALLILESPLNLCIITGSTNLRMVERNLNAEKKHSICVESIESVDQISTYMNWADIAICGGGATTWELAFMGVPFLAVSYNKSEQGNLEALSALSLCTNMGRNCDLSPNDVLKNFSMWATDYESRRLVAENGPTVIDGKGYARIVFEIKGLIRSSNDDYQGKNIQ